MVRLAIATLLACCHPITFQQPRQEGGQAPPSQPASQPAARTTPRNPEQARILKELLRGSERRRAQPIVSEPVRGRSAESSAAAAAGATLVEGSVLIERVGRLVRSGDRSEFHFKAGGSGDDRLKAMEFNKNSWLELMEAEADAGVEEFVISAEVTRYRGRNYLLLLKYRRQISHGNISP